MRQDEFDKAFDQLPEEQQEELRSLAKVIEESGLFRKDMTDEEKKARMDRFRSFMDLTKEFIDVFFDEVRDSYPAAANLPTFEFLDWVSTDEGKDAAKRAGERLKEAHSEEPTATTLASVVTKSPQQAILLTDKLSRDYFDGGISTNPAEPSRYGLERVGSKKEITTTAYLTFDNLPQGVSIPEAVANNPDAEVVHQAYCSLYDGNDTDCFTYQMIYRTIVNDPDARITPEWQKRIHEATNLMMGSNITIDSEQEATAYGHSIMSYDGKVLAAERVTRKINGQVVDGCIHLLREPILFSLAKGKGQIARIDPSVLPVSLDNSSLVVRLKNYLQHRIEGVRGKQSNKILFDTLYKEMGIPTGKEGTARKQQHDLRLKVYVILNDWKKSKYLRGYQLESETKTLYKSPTAAKGKTIRAIIVFPAKKIG